MLLGIIYCVLALVCAGTVGVLGCTIYDCRDLIGKAVSGILVFAAVLMLVETVLLMGVGIALIFGCH